jgi:exopolysaccharide biosynthesis protein
MTAVQRLNHFMLLASAPFIGSLLFLLTLHPSMKGAEFEPLVTNPISIQEQTSQVQKKIKSASQNSVLLKGTIVKNYKLYNQTNSDVVGMLKLAKAQVNRPAAIFEGRVTKVLGNPTKQANSDNIDIKLYTYIEQDVKGYALKVNLKTSNAMKMVLGKDKLRGSETTLSAVNRYKAIAGINAGGFADARDGRYPTGNTFYNKKLIFGFFPPSPHIAGSFVGLNTAGRLIGGRFKEQADLDKLKPVFGASFEPVLMQNGAKLSLPKKWLTSPARASRTVIGNFSNNQLIILVANGANERGSSGATLPEMQDRMQRLGIRDAYNLDGGGSTTLVFNGQVINKPSDGRLRALPTHFLFFK